MKEFMPGEGDFTPENVVSIATTLPKAHKREILIPANHSSVEDIQKRAAASGFKPPEKSESFETVLSPKHKASNSEESLQFLQDAGIVRQDVAQINPNKESPLTADAAAILETVNGKKPEPLKPPTVEQQAAFEEALRVKKVGSLDVVGETDIGGVRALKLKDSKTGQISLFRLQQTEGVVAAGTISEFPPAMDIVQLRNHIRVLVDREEGTPGRIDTDTIDSIVNRINGYVVIGGATRQEIKNLTLEVEARLNLAAADIHLTFGSGDEFAKYYSNMNSERFNLLRDEILGATGLEVIHRMEQPDPVGPGAFFRLPVPARQAAILAAIHYIEITDGISNDKARKKYEIIQSLFNTSGMSTFYTGPVDPLASRGAPAKLLETQFMADAVEVGINVTPAAGGPGTGDVEFTLPNPNKLPIINGKEMTDSKTLKSDPMLIYERNERYWKFKARFRRRMKDRLDPADPTRDNGTQIKFASGEHSPLLRRVFYFPEELDRRVYATGGEKTGKAKSMFGAAELYVIPLPHMMGTNNLENFLGPIGVQAGDFLSPGYDTTAPSENLVKKDRTARYANMVKGAAGAVDNMINLLNVPVKGEAQAGSLKNLGNNLGNLFESIKSLSYIGGYAPNILSYAVSRLLIGTLDYINSNAKDRWREFKNIPRFGPQTMNAIISAEAFTSIMDKALQNETLESVGAPLNAITRIKAGQAASKTGISVLDALMKAISRR